MISTHTPPRASPETSSRILIVSAASLFIDYMAYGMMVPLTPVSPAGIDCTADESIIVFAYSIGMLIAATNIGRLCRRLSPRSQMLAGTTTLGCALCLIGSATHLSIYLLGRFFQGVAGAVTSIVGYAAVARAYPNQRVRMLAVVLGAGSAGFVIGPVFGGLLFGVGSYGLPFLCFGLPVVLLGLGQWRYLKGNSVNVVSAVDVINAAHVDKADNGAETTSRRSHTSHLPLQRPSIALPALLAALCAASWATLEGLVPLTLYQDYAQTPQAVGTLFSANSLLAMLTNFLIVMFAGKVTSSQLAIIGMASSCAIFLTLAWIAHIYVLRLAVPLAGVAYSLLINASTALFAERVDGTGSHDDIYQKAYGTFSTAYGLGYGVGSGLEYLFASFASFHSITLAVGCLFGSLLPLVFGYLARARGRSGFS